MKKIFVSSCYCLFFCYAFSQYPNDMNSYNVSGITVTKFSDANRDIHLEIPPWTIAGGWHTYLMVSGANTTTYSSPDNMIYNSSIECKNRGPYFATGPESTKPWKRNYSSIYSAHYFSHPSIGNMNIGFCHNENKNQCNFQNTINPYISPNCSISGNDYRAYYALVSSVWTTNNAGNNWGQQGYSNDLGPILWPSVGFIASDNTSATEGLLQPSSIVVGNYIYIFIWDKGPKSNLVQGQEGRTRGMKLVRTTLANCTNPNKYEVYYKDDQGNTQWLPSLPIGFTKETMLQYVRVQGPKSTDILFDQIGSNTQAFRFSVAQVKNQNYFIGCEEYVDNNNNQRHYVALRFSYDLMNWSSRKKIIETSMNWDQSLMNYPILLSADGWSNTLIDLDNFYVVGSHSQSPFPNTVNKINIKLYVPQPPQPPRPPCGQPRPCPIERYQNTFSSIKDQLKFDLETSQMSYGQISPNPNNGIFQVTIFNEENEFIDFNIIDANGKIIYRSNKKFILKGLFKEKIDIRNAANGLFILEILTNRNKKTYKFLKN